MWEILAILGCVPFSISNHCVKYVGTRSVFGLLSPILGQNEEIIYRVNKYPYSVRIRENMNYNHGHILRFLYTFDDPIFFSTQVK